ncbi:MAG: hypothetical protein WC707_07070 [Candidatus Babeliaceae bacterium]
MIEIIEKSNIHKGKKYITGESYGDTYFVPVVDGVELSYMAETWEMAMLIGLGRKLDGINTRFPEYAGRMLGIKSAWTE